MPEKFRANIKEMIGLIADRLYNNTADIVVRELVQNSYDSVIRRYGQSAPQNGSIIFTTLASPPTLTITDNGEGMDGNELRNYLSVLGQSLKKLSSQPRTGTRSSIGEYGIGFFACFMIADAITVRTRKPGSKIMFTWQSEGDEDFSIETAPAGKCPEGTSVTLLLQHGSSKFADPGKLSEVILRFCGSLNCPIKLDDSSEPINAQTFPWELSTPAAKRGWIERHFDRTSHFKTGTHRNKGISFGYAICYTVPDNAKQEIYCKRMFVTSTLNFVPEQFEFINVIVNCDTLKLNLARDEVTENTAFRHLQEGLEDLLWDFLKGLLEIRKQDHQIETYFKELQPAMRRRVLNDQKAINKFAPYLLFETATSSHLSTIPEYLDATKLPERKVLFITQSKEHGLPSGHLDRLLLYTCERKQIPVVLVEPQEQDEVLRRVCVSLKALKTRLSDVSDLILGPTTADNKSLEAVQANFSRVLGRSVRVGKFPPPSLPLTLSDHEIILNQESPLLAHFAKLELDSELSRNLYLRCFETCESCGLRPYHRVPPWPGRKSRAWC
jgi:molecular chaperone HtpG